MALNSVQGRVWNRITNAYQLWDEGRSEMMAIDDLADKLPDVEREVIGETLAAALIDGRLTAFEESGMFRPIPNH